MDAPRMGRVQHGAVAGTAWLGNWPRPRENRGVGIAVAGTAGTILVRNYRGREPDALLW